jgi:hypothetical protein
MLDLPEFQGISAARPRSAARREKSAISVERR